LCGRKARKPKAVALVLHAHMESVDPSHSENEVTP
jgi:hypothetical protein